VLAVEAGALVWARDSSSSTGQGEQPSGGAAAGGRIDLTVQDDEARLPGRELCPDNDEALLAQSHAGTR